MSEMDYEHLIVEERGDALWVTMNRPASLNALNRRLVEELRDLFAGLYWRHEVRVVVLRGAGPNYAKAKVLLYGDRHDHARRSPQQRPSRH